MSNAIEKPRGYQQEILEQAKKSNVIAFLETGAGKTLVSALLVQHILENPASKGRIAVFIVDKVALVHQQAEYMRDICQYNVGTYYGDMGLDDWSGVRWLEEFAQKRILVLTAQIFLNALRHGLILMKCVALLVFDEVHHATRQHPFRRIMVDFYHTLEKDVDRPRVFGMTASPVKVKAGTKSVQDCGEAIAMLEVTMDAKIVGVSDHAQEELDALVPTAAEFVAEYNASEEDDDDPVQKEDDLAVNSGLDALVPSLTHRGMAYDRAKFEGTVKKSRALLAKGSASDMNVLLRKVHFALGKHVAMYLSQELATTSPTAKYRDFCTRQTLMEGPIISDRVKVLLDLLLDERKRWGRENVGNEESFRCIVFVHQRLFAFAVSWLINSILGELKTKSFESRAVVGCHAKSSHLRMSQMQQNEVLNDFRRGVFGVLVATNVVEEGLDIPACSLVIAFDAVLSAKAYIQARGRARSPGSHYVALIPRNSALHTDSMAKAYHGSLLMKETVRALNAPLENMEKWREELVLEAQKSLDDTSEVVLVSKSTPARVLPAAALTLLYRYCWGLVDCRPRLDPHYNLRKSDMGYFCTVRLPEQSPVAKADSETYQNSGQLAKRVAALNAYRKLYEAGEVDEYLLPKLRFAKKPPGEPRRYRGTKGPKIPQRVRHCYVSHSPPLQRVRLSKDQDNVQTQIQTPQPEVKLMHLYVVHRQRSPPISAKPDEWQGGSRYGVILEHKVEEDDLTALLCPTGGTLLRLEYIGEIGWTDEKERLIRKFMHITEGCVRGHFPQWLSILEEYVQTDDETDGDTPRMSVESVDEAGSLCTVSHVSKEKHLDVECGSYGDLEDTKTSTTEDEITEEEKAKMKFLRRKRQKIFSEHQRKDETPGFFFAPLLEENIPVDASGRMNPIDWNAVYPLADYAITGAPSESSTSDWSFSFAVSNHERNDRVYFVVKALPGVTMKSKPNGLVSQRFQSIGAYYLKRHEIDLTHETEELLEGYGVTEFMSGERKNPFPLCRSTCYYIPLAPWAVYTAALLPSWQTFLVLKESWRAVCKDESLKFLSFARSVQPNMGKLPRIGPELNYERNEFLGDAVLKLVSSMMAYANAPAGNEGLLTDHRDDEIANEHLCNVAVEYGVHNCIAFTGITRKAKKWEWFWGIPQIVNSPFSEKVLADCIEALIGAHYLQGGLESAVHFMDRLGVVKGADVILKVGQYKYESISAVEEEMRIRRCRDKRIAKVEEILQYKFRSKDIVIEALTHGSYASGKARSYQRLEFLGDAAIGFVLLSRFFHENPSLGPGELSALREPTLSNDVFARVAVCTGLHQLIWLDCVALDRDIKKFARALRSEKDGEDVCKLQTVPKVLGDILESLIGAIVVDQGMRLDGVEDIVVRLMAPMLKKFANPALIIEHPVSKISQVVQAATGKVPEFVYRESEQSPRNENESEAGVKISRGMMRARVKTEMTVAECVVLVAGKEIGCGKGANRRVAKHVASLDALKRFKSDGEKSGTPVYDI